MTRYIVEWFRQGEWTSMNTVSHQFQLAVDVGGTFTDLVFCDETGKVEALKLPTVPEEPSEGVMSLLAIAARQRGLSLEDFLSRTGRFVHGTTIATGFAPLARPTARAEASEPSRRASSP